jgi:hypothetical protein
MGWFKKKQKNQKVQEFDDGMPVSVYFNDGSSILAMNPEMTTRIAIHPDGRRYAIMMFDVSNRAQSGETIYVTTANKVVVEKELNSDGTCNPLTKREMYDYTIHYVSQMLAGLHQDPSKICRYIGRINPENPKEMLTAPETQEAIDNELEPAIRAARREKEEQKRAAREAREAKEAAERMIKAREENQKRQEQEFIERQQRIQNGKFDCISVRENGKIRDYNGVDLATGRVLKVRELTKHGKDRQGIYLYTARVFDAYHEHDIESLDAKDKIMAFTTPIKIEDLIKTPEGKTHALELFSRGNHEAQYDDGVKFIGNLNWNGELYSTYITHCSPEIQTEYNKINQRVLDKQEAIRQSFAPANRAKVSEIKPKDSNERDFG